MKKFVSIFLCTCLLVTAMACGATPSGEGGDDEYQKQYDLVINDGKPVTITVDLNNFLPTTNTVADEHNPIVFRSIQTITDHFMVEFPNVTVKWNYNKKTLGNWEQWMTTQVATDNPPDIVMMQGAKYADRGWFYPLNDILEQPNPFVREEDARGAEHWQDMFPGYMWSSSMTTDAAGNILAVPLSVYPGTATAYFYNKDIFEELRLEVPTTWDEFMTVCAKIKAAGYTAVAPWSLNDTINVDVWDIQYSLGPTFADKIRDQWDYDGDGNMSQEEKLRAAYEGVFYGRGKNRDNLMAMLGEVMKKYSNVLDPGAANTDYEPLWNKGKVAMMEDGMWRISQEAANTERKFEYGIFPTPLADSATSQYCADFTFGEGAYNPPIAESYNICKQAVEKKGQGNLEASVRFLQWLTLPENLNLMVDEKDGQCLGAVYGTYVPESIRPFIQGQFPRTPNCTWMTGATVATQEQMSSIFEFYAISGGAISEDDFLREYDSYLYQGVQTLMKSLGIDPAARGWTNGYVW